MNLRRKPSLKEVDILLRRSLSLSNPAIVYTLLAREVPKGWSESPHLRHCHPLFFSEDGALLPDQIPNVTRVQLDAELGLVIEYPDRQRTAPPPT